MSGFCCNDLSCIYCFGTGFVVHDAKALEPGHYWAKHVSGIRDPEVVWICKNKTVQVIGDDYSYDLNSFVIIEKTELKKGKT